MTTALRACRVRLACNVDSHDSVVDSLTSRAVITWRGVPVNVEFALFVGSDIIDSKAEISKVYLQLHSSRSLGPLWVKEIAGSALDVTVTKAQWDAGTHEQDTFELDETDMQIDLTDSTDEKRTLYWVMWVELTDGTPITVGTGQWIIEEDGAGNGLPLVPGSNYNVRQGPTRGLAQLQSPRTGLWHDIALRDEGDGSPVSLVINQTGEA